MPALAPARIAAVLRDSPNAIRQVISPRYWGSEREWKFSIFFAPRPRPERNEDRRVEHRAALEDLGDDRFDGRRLTALGEHLVGQSLDQAAVGEDLERRSRLTPAGRDDVVFQLLEVDIAHFGQHVAGELDRESAGAQLVVVRIVRMAGEIGAEGQIDRLGEHVLQRVVARDRDREAALVDREAILVEDSHPLEEVVVRAAAAAPCATISLRSDFSTQVAARAYSTSSIVALIEHQVQHANRAPRRFGPVRVA